MRTDELGLFFWSSWDITKSRIDDMRQKVVNILSNQITELPSLAKAYLDLMDPKNSHKEKPYPEETIVFISTMCIVNEGVCKLMLDSFHADPVALSRLCTQGEVHLTAFLTGQHVFSDELVPLDSHSAFHATYPTLLGLAHAFCELYLFGSTLSQTMSYPAGIRKMQDFYIRASEPNTQCELMPQVDRMIMTQ